MRALIVSLSFLLASASAQAQDASAGEDLFKRCAACHVAATPDGEVLAGSRARAGPNLYAVVGRTAGTRDDFRYSSAMVDAGEAGLVWTPDLLIEYVQDPLGFLQTFLDNKRARGRMAFQVKAEDAPDIVAFLQSLGPS